MPQINVFTFGLNTEVSYNVCIYPILMRLDSVILCGFQTIVPTFTATIWECKSVMRYKCCSPDKSESTLLDIAVQRYKRRENV